jgi:hypothetical protein
MMKVEPATEQMLKFIVARLRDLDKRELTASGADFDNLAKMAMAQSVFAFCAVDHLYLPQAAWGLTQIRPGVGGGWAFGTRHWARAVPIMTRNIRRWVLPFLLGNGFHRVEASALAHRKDVARFMGFIGAQPEAVLRQWGKGGEDFVLYRWLADEHRAATQTDRHVSH